MEEKNTKEKTVGFITASNSSSNSNDIVFSRASRWFIFIQFIFVLIFTSIDQGIMPTAINDIKTELSLTDTDFGLLSSLFYLGKIFGSLVFIVLINIIHRRSIIIICLLIISLSLAGFTFCKYMPVILASRVIHGFFQIFFIIYFPVWCDQYGIRNKKTMMLTFIQMGMPLGIMVGCVIGTFIPWKMGMIIEIISSVLIAFTFLFVDRRLFSSTIYVQNISDKKSLYSEKANKPSDHSECKKDETIMSMFTNKHFIFCCFSRGFLLFPLTAMNQWTIHYMENALGITDKKIKLISFAVISATSPTIGTVIGGMVGTKIGGYENKRASFACVLLYLGSCAGVILIPLMNNIWTFTFAFWLCLVFCAAIIPILTGVIISAVPNCLRGSAGSVTSFISNLFGHMPAPIVYGYINDRYKHTNPRMAMTVVLYVSFICLIFLILSAITRYSQDEPKSEEKNVENLIHKTNITRNSLVNNALGEVYGNPVDIENEDGSSAYKSFANTVTHSLKSKFRFQSRK